MALWIKMKQGTLSLNIETFSLDELFELLGKGRRSFEMKKQTLEIEPTAVMVKADRALTLFMINTLAENARKYTRKEVSLKFMHILRIHMWRFLWKITEEESRKKMWRVS